MSLKNQRSLKNFQEDQAEKPYRKYKIVMKNLYKKVFKSRKKRVAKYMEA